MFALQPAGIALMKVLPAGAASIQRERAARSRAWLGSDRKRRRSIYPVLEDAFARRAM
jgi:hypothetical protein